MAERMESYKLIRQQITNDIIRGIYPPGTIIPKQEEFALKYGVSRGTIRKAVDDLVEKGILISTKRKGTVVAEKTMEVRDIYRPISFSSSKRVDRQQLKSKIISLENITAEPWIARQLGVPVGEPLIHLKRIRILNGTPENYQISYFSRSRLNNLDLNELDLENGSLFSQISEITGLYAMKKTEDIRAVRCPKFVAEGLEMNENDPILLIMRMVYAQDHLPLEYCEDYESTDRKGLIINTEGQITKEVSLEENHE